MLDDLVKVHNEQRKNNRNKRSNGNVTMGESMIYIVFDYDGNIYGVYEEYVDAEERVDELDISHQEFKDFEFHIEEYQLNKDNVPSA